jgi:hypothetical protein
MHPDFGHHHKRFSLFFVVTCLSLMLGPCRSIRSVGKRFGVSRHTVRRWFDGFTKQNIISKRLCFFGSGVAQNGENVLQRLFAYFDALSNGKPDVGMAAGMKKLADNFSCALY